MSIGPVDLRFPVRWRHPLNRGRLAWWLCLRPWMGGSVWRDLTRRYDAALTAIAPGSAWGGTSRPGGRGQLTFDGVDDRADSTANVTSTATATVAVWCRYSNAAQNGILVGIAAVNSNFELFLEGGLLKWRGNTGSGNGASVTAPAANAWHRVVGVASGSTRTLYVDGALAATATGQAGNGVAGGALRCGYFPTASYQYAGQLDDLGYWPARALTAAEVLDDYDLSRRGYPGMLNRRRRACGPPAASSVNRSAHFYRILAGAA